VEPATRKISIFSDVTKATEKDRSRIVWDLVRMSDGTAVIFRNAASGLFLSVGANGEPLAVPDETKLTLLVLEQIEGKEVAAIRGLNNEILCLSSSAGVVVCAFLLEPEEILKRLAASPSPQLPPSAQQALQYVQVVRTAPPLHGPPFPVFAAPTETPETFVAAAPPNDSPLTVVATAPPNDSPLTVVATAPPNETTLTAITSVPEVPSQLTVAAPAPDGPDDERDLREMDESSSSSSTSSSESSSQSEPENETKKMAVGTSSPSAGKSPQQEAKLEAKRKARFEAQEAKAAAKRQFREEKKAEKEEKMALKAAVKASKLAAKAAGITKAGAKMKQQISASTNNVHLGAMTENDSQGPLDVLLINNATGRSLRIIPGETPKFDCGGYRGPFARWQTTTGSLNDEGLRSVQLTWKYPQRSGWSQKPPITALKEFQTPRPGFSCDGCHIQVPADTTLYGCRLLNYDLCEPCFFARVAEPEDNESQRQFTFTLEGHQWFYHSPEGHLFCQPERSSSSPLLVNQPFSLPAFFSTEGGDKRQLLGEFVIPSGHVFQRLTVDALEWADQGSGDQKGLMFASLLGSDGSQVGQEVRLFGPAPHSMTTYMGSFGLDTFDIHAESAEAVKKVLFTFRVGAGAVRHSLIVKTFNGSLVVASPITTPARLYVSVDEKNGLTLSPVPSTTFSCLKMAFSHGRHAHFRAPLVQPGRLNDETLQEMGSFLKVHLKELGLPVDVSLEECKKEPQCEASSSSSSPSSSSSAPPVAQQVDTSRIPQLFGNLLRSILTTHTDQCNELAQAVMGPDAVAITKLADGRVSIILNPPQ